MTVRFIHGGYHLPLHLLDKPVLPKSRNLDFLFTKRKNAAHQAINNSISFALFLYVLEGIFHSVRSLVHRLIDVCFELLLGTGRLLD